MATAEDSKRIFVRRKRGEPMLAIRIPALRLLVIAAAFIFGAPFAALAQQPDPSTKAAPAKPRALPTQAKEWKGDFDGMLKRRHIRFLVPYSRTLYFNDKGRE